MLEALFQVVGVKIVLVNLIMIVIIGMCYLGYIQLSLIRV